MGEKQGGLVICTRRMDGVVVETVQVGTVKMKEVVEGKTIDKDVPNFRTTLDGKPVNEAVGEELARNAHARLIYCP